VENVSRHWQDFQFMDGEIHDLDKDHFENQCKGAFNRYTLRVALRPSK
jgi:hypothetical protein